jgi:hypothetical protein
LFIKRGSGEVMSFAADFEQHCEGMNPAVYDSVRFASDFSLPVVVGAEVEGQAVTNVICINKTTGKPAKIHPESVLLALESTEAGV